MDTDDWGQPVITTYYACYDSSEDSDFYPYDTETEALAVATRWAAEDWYADLAERTDYCAITVRAITYTVAPWDADEDWCLWWDDDAVVLAAVAG